MTAISKAIGLERVSATSGFKINKLIKGLDSSNLPMNILIIGEANTDKQGGLSTDKVELTTAKEAIELFGDGSPIHQAMRILRPIQGDGVGGIPTFVMPLATPVGSTSTSIDLGVTGTATSNGVHTIFINGRGSLDFQSYDINIATGDTATDIVAKMAVVINDVKGSVCVAVANASTLETESKSKGISSIYNIYVDTNNKDLGVSYAESANTQGAGTPDLADAFSKFGTDWHTIVVNPYLSKWGEFEVFNGTPESATGRYTPNEFYPFLSLTGSSLDDKDDLVAITDDSSRVDQNTNYLCTAPLSKSTSIEIAANYAYLVANTAQDTPELDVFEQYLPDINVPENSVIGDMSIYNNRDFLVKKGCSTVVLNNGKYQVIDFVSTYHPDGESPFQYSYGRNALLDFNYKWGYDVLENLYVKGKVLVDNALVTDNSNSISPKQWKAVMFDYHEDLENRLLITDASFSDENIEVQISSTNPNRMETRDRIKRTGIARIQSTTVEIGFN